MTYLNTNTNISYCEHVVLPLYVYLQEEMRNMDGARDTSVSKNSLINRTAMTMTSILIVFNSWPCMTKMMIMWFVNWS